MKVRGKLRRRQGSAMKCKVSSILPCYQLANSTHLFEAFTLTKRDDEAREEARWSGRMEEGKRG